MGDPRRRGLFTSATEILVPLHAVPGSLDERVDPRVVVWLCKGCRSIVRGVGEEIEGYWSWPGARPPRATRWVSRLDTELHNASLVATLSTPERDRASAYCQRYLSSLRAPEAWLGRVLRDDGQAIVDEDLRRIWLAYARAWCDRQRRARESDTPCYVLPIEAVRQRGRRSTKRETPPAAAPAKARHRRVARYDETVALRTLDEAEAAFDARIAAILARTQQ